MDQGVTRDKSAGFTLIELMIVVTILSLLTLSVSLGLSRPRNESAQDWSRFMALHDRLRGQAILSGDILGLTVDADGYQRVRWLGGDWVGEGTRAPWRDPVVVIAPTDRRAPLVFGPGGQSTAVNLQFGTGTGATRCISDGWAPVTCSRS